MNNNQIRVFMLLLSIFMLFVVFEVKANCRVDGSPIPHITIDEEYEEDLVEDNNSFSYEPDIFYREPTATEIESEFRRIKKDVLKGLY